MESTSLLPTVFRRLRRVGVAALVIVASQENPAWAQSAAVAAAGTPESPHPVRVHYRVEGETGGGACLSHARIQSATSRALKRAVFFPAPESDVVVVVRTRGGFGAEVSLFDVAGQSLGSRRLKAEACGELVELLVFTLTVMVDFGSDEVGRKREEAQQAERDAQTAGLPHGETDAGAVAGETPAAPSPEASKVAPQTTNEPKPLTSQWSRAVNTPTTHAVAGAIVETGLTPTPLLGLFGQLVFTGGAPLVFAAGLRGQHMFETPRAAGTLGAWRAAVTGRACWLKGAPDEWVMGVCLGVTPSVSWVSARGFDSDRWTAIVGVGVEPTFDLAFPLTPGLGGRVGIGGGIPVLRNDWHVRTSNGQQVNLFRAEAVGVLATVGLRWGDE